MTVVNDPKISYRIEDGWVDALTGVFESTAFPYGSDFDAEGNPMSCSVGVDGILGWEPTTVITDANYRILEPDAVVEDVRIINGSFEVYAPRVTLRRCELINGSYTNDGAGVGNGLLMEDCTARGVPLGTSAPLNTPFTVNGYTCNRCAILGGIEGWHTGGSQIPLMDPDHPDTNTIRLYNCYASIHYPIGCVEDGIDWHGDVFQGFDGIPVGGGVQNIIRNCVMRSTDASGGESCGASAIIGIGAGHSQPVDFDGVILSGSGVPLHADTGGKFRNIYIDASTTPYFFPVSIEAEWWPPVTVWENVWIVDGITPDGQPGPIIAGVPFGYPGYGPLDPPPGD